MKKELTAALIIFLALVADSLCFRQIYLRESEIYPKTSVSFLLIAAGAVLLVIFGFFIKRLFAKQN